MTTLADFCEELSSKDDVDIKSPQQQLQFYDVINSLFTKRSVGVVGGGFSPKAVLRAISMDSSLLMLCARLSKYCYGDKDLFLAVLKGVLPKRNRGFGFFKYLKTETVGSEDILSSIAKHFSTSLEESRQVLAILEHEGVSLREVGDFFGMEKVNF